MKIKTNYISVNGGATFTNPRDGQTYNIVTIGNQIWFAENLNFIPNKKTIGVTTTILIIVDFMASFILGLQPRMSVLPAGIYQQITNGKHWKCFLV